MKKYYFVREWILGFCTCMHVYSRSINYALEEIESKNIVEKI